MTDMDSRCRGTTVMPERKLAKWNVIAKTADLSQPTSAGLGSAYNTMIDFPWPAVEWGLLLFVSNNISWDNKISHDISPPPESPLHSLYLAGDTHGGVGGAAGDGGGGNGESGRRFHDHLLGFWCVWVATWAWWLRGTMKGALWWALEGARAGRLELKK